MFKLFGIDPGELQLSQQEQLIQSLVNGGAPGDPAAEPAAATA